MKHWNLTHDNFSWMDRLKMSAFLLNKKRIWTRGEQTKTLEGEMWQRFLCHKRPIFVSSGSTANTLIAMYWKDKFYTPKRNKIIFPATTWATSVSPFIREGFEPIFVDIEKDCFFANVDHVINLLDRDDVCGVFLTTLLGFCPTRDKILKLKRACNKAGVQLAFDHCESTLSKDEASDSFFTWGLSTTSSYFSHFLQSIEGGFVFPENDGQRDYFLSLMNHGMTRFCKNAVRNSGVDPMFDFWTVGNNFRNSDVNAYACRLSLRKSNKDGNHRRDLYCLYWSKINEKYTFIDTSFVVNPGFYEVPFALPLVFKSEDTRDVFKKLLEKKNIDTRPIISGNLVKHTAFSRYRTEEQVFPIADILHNRGLYLGLHRGVKERDILELVKLLQYE